ncbi:MAG: hypothetical protein RMK20_09585 [Verrucomicrobiales bacterium]|nr:hypothetical protein [Verrucomicrobiales bacterium]
MFFFGWLLFLGLRWEFKNRSGREGLPDCTFAESDRLIGNLAANRVTWQGRHKVGLPGRAVMLQMPMKRAKRFACEMECGATAISER